MMNEKSKTVISDCQYKTHSRLILLWLDGASPGAGPISLPAYIIPSDFESKNSRLSGAHLLSFSVLAPPIITHGSWFFVDRLSCALSLCLINKSSGKLSLLIANLWWFLLSCWYTLNKNVSNYSDFHQSGSSTGFLFTSMQSPTVVGK